MSVFDFSTYKQFLLTYIEKAGRRGIITELAVAAGCSQSYLSQVLHGKPDLTPDQAWELVDYLRLSSEEAEYFFNLVLLGRAANPKLKTNLDVKLKNIKNEQLHTTKMIKKSTDKVLTNEQRDRYYNNWVIGAIHTLTSCREYQSPDDIAERLNLSLQEVEHHLKWLIDNRLVKKEGRRFSHTGKSIHLPTEAIHNQINHLQWRLKAIQTSTRLDEIHYTSTFTISKSDWDILRSELLAFIEFHRKSIQASGSEEGYSFCCDLFKI